MDVPTDEEQRSPLRALREDAWTYVQETPRKSLVALLLGPLLITLSMRLATVDTARAVLPLLLRREQITDLRLWFWVFGLQFFLLYLIPVACVRFVFGESLEAYGHQLRPMKKLWPLILLFLAVMLPITYLSSLHPAFRKFYPLYAGSYRGWDHFLLFEAGLFFVFYAQEFFFRSFLVDSLAPQLGYNAVLVATGIYGVAHYTKPLPEQLGAFFVGNLLGYLGLRYRTFLFGVIVHFGVALTMDSLLVVPVLLRARGK